MPTLHDRGARALCGNHSGAQAKEQQSTEIWKAHRHLFFRETIAPWNDRVKHSALRVEKGSFEIEKAAIAPPVQVQLSKFTSEDFRAS